jgi:hypothetical protein
MQIDLRSTVKKGAYQNFAPINMKVITLHLGFENTATDEGVIN